MINVNARKLQSKLYDSDDQDSMVSEPGSPPDVAMSSGDEEMGHDDTLLYSQSHDSEERNELPNPARPSFHSRMQQTHRVPTPINPPSSRPGVRPMQVRTNFGGHIRHRHPQENLGNSSDMLEVPSPIDEDEVPTPPSAAEAAGSQFSMLTVNDMDLEPSESVLPTISIDHSQTSPFGEHVQQSLEAESAIADGFEPMESSGGLDAGLVIRKQRARSGALSAGHGSPSPARAEPARPDQMGFGRPRRVLSMGFRADCAKCQARVPGHFNHWF